LTSKEDGRLLGSMLTGERQKASKEYKRRAACARRVLRERGWSVRRAATFLDRNYVHLHYVLHAKRISDALLTRVLELPQSPVSYTASGFGRKHR
jgi:hypothetical protein